MIQQEIFFSKELFILALSFSFFGMLYMFGGQIINDLKLDTSVNTFSVSTFDIYKYFVGIGFSIKKIEMLENSTNCLVFVFKNGESQVYTLLIEQGKIMGHTNLMLSNDSK